MGFALPRRVSLPEFEPAPRTAMPSTPLPERLRFAEFTLDRLPNGRCRARVGLTWRDSEQFTGEGEGLASQAGELRCSAHACVVALGQAVQGGLSFELLGVKAVRAFDAETDTPRGAALAVLNATNRILGNRLFMR